MKKYFLGLVFMLIGVFSYASSYDFYASKNISTFERVLNNSIKGVKTVVTFVITEEGTCTVYHYVYYDGELVHSFETQEPDDSELCGGIVFHMLKKVDD